MRDMKVWSFTGIPYMSSATDSRHFGIRRQICLSLLNSQKNALLQTKISLTCVELFQESAGHNIIIFRTIFFVLNFVHVPFYSKLRNW